MRISLTALTGDGPADVIASGDDGTTVGALAEALARTLSIPGQRLAEVVPHPRWGDERIPARTDLWANGRRLDPSAPVGNALRDGDLVTLEAAAAAATWRSEPTGIVELRVSGGPAAGSVHRLGFGTATLGRSGTAAVEDPLLPPVAAHVHVSAHETVVEPVAGAAVTLDGRPLTEARPWPDGGVLVAGASVLTLRVPESPDAHLTPMPDGGLAYNRPPRLVGPARTRTVEVPAEPARPDHHRLQLLSTMIFAVGGVVMAIVFKQALFLLMALLTPLSMVGQWYSDRRYGKKRHRQALKEYRERKAAFSAELDRLTRVDQDERRAEFPDPADVLLTATGPRRRLWERRIHDADTLHLRIGLADQPANIELVPERGLGGSPGELPAIPVSHAVPVTVPLPRLGVMGVTGARPASRALARWLVAQAAALHSPRDLAIVVLSADPEAASSWSWVRWLPHCAPHDGEDCVALVGADPESAARRVTELVNRINERRAVRRDSSFGDAPQGYASDLPYNVLVVLDGARVLRGLAGMPQVLQLGPTAGVYAICVDDDQRLLPEECAAVAVCDYERPWVVRLRGAGLDPLGDVIGDQVTLGWCDRTARAMAAVRDVSREDADSAIPSSARLLDLLGMPDPRPDQIRAFWRRGRTTRVPIGIGADGPYLVDLRLDGPHGLVAGTTGAGKSELLQTLIASLAVANRPDEMTFVLIDYKGGSAFKDCAKLPHTVGMVSDLDGHLTERALESLAAELKRREHLLLRADAKDVEDYNDLRDSGLDLEPMPRLVLVIDEFAAMVQELPDFVVGLVDIARRGRSLGVHLILATQRPAGVVTPDIAANTNLRIALRVTSGGESSDVINSPGAASISKSTPGRCYVRSGASSLHAVQSARIGGRRPGTGPARAEPVEVVPLAWPRLGLPLPARGDEDGEESTMVTDLAVLVEAVADAARAEGVAQQRSPWLPPLPDALTLDQLEPEDWTRLPFGLADIPSLQRRAAECYDLAAGGHLVVSGASRTGRSTVLRAVAGAVGRHTDPRDVHLYAVDCGNNALLPLVGLPHTGAVVGRDSPDRLARLTDRLLEEIARRQQLLAAQGFADVSEQRAAAGDPLPYVLVLFDRWEGFMAAFESYDNGTLIDKWLQILQEGAGAGVKVVMTGDRSTLVGRISTQFDDRLVLKLTDPIDYSYVGIKAKDVPEHFPPGRGFRASTGIREVQVALLAADPAGTAQVAALHEIARTARARAGDLPRAARPFRVDALPPVVGLAETLALVEDPLPADAVVFGVGGDTLGVRYFRAEEHGPGIVVAGPPKTGRSTALCTMLASLLDRSYEAVLITPRRSPLRDFAGRPGVRGSFTADSPVDEVKEAARAGGRHVLMIDDLELLGGDSELAEWITDYVGELRDTGSLVIGAGSADDLDSMYRGPVVAMKKSRNGLLLRPSSPGQGDLLGVRLPRSLASGTGPAGRGLLVIGGAWEQVQVARPEG
ncbi:FtsK/SpoIIIE domain-containing protein [Microbispora sp. ATCC PTA-5024]|uniref:FtsK/SpoIIIE domain-containing protein n=1 Tax=Microbispora sp. ATCC PTA-5024 TaxID=316330 RepID=UPI0003DC8E08|nr:FtsK/SpoIIIE domain-containing protein [Microbispora sp. ATCC PTA-5024]ETK33281.1 cell division protein FtsK [Microbispora sp. ATCC PTA-5024]